jgi:hypothetical protein
VEKGNDEYFNELDVRAGDLLRLHLCAILKPKNEFKSRPHFVHGADLDVN